MLRFALEFPEGWDVMNTPAQVAAREPGQQHFMLLQTVDQPRGRTLEEIALRSMSSARLQARSTDSAADSTALDAHVGVYQGSIRASVTSRMRAAHIVSTAAQVYLLAGFAPRDEFAQVDRDIDAADPIVPAADRSAKPMTSAPTGSTSTPCARATRGSRLRRAAAD